MWYSVLYAPLFNLLIYLYNSVAVASLGVAVISLTLTIRLFLLPFSILSERSAHNYEKLQKKLHQIEAESSSDPVLKKERMRDLLRIYKINPWAKALVLAIQFLILVVLYQVFLGGINQKLDDLYPWVVRPEVINTMFLGFDLGKRHLGWALAVGIFLFVEIGISLRRRAHVDRTDLGYLLIFPFGAFCILWYLPMVKSLFILTSLVFSVVLGIVRRTILKSAG